MKFMKNEICCVYYAVFIITWNNQEINVKLRLKKVNAYWGFMTFQQYVSYIGLIR